MDNAWFGLFLLHFEFLFSYSPTGDAFANEDFVRLTPDRQSKTGGVWNSQPMLWKNWEVMVQFNVNGISQVGADGLAWWLAEEVNVIGDFFGFRERFHGIGVAIDTYDNDGSGKFFSSFLFA